ncbi:DUF3566 domain-containing protein [Longimycelium tulufanense]|uniref:DUF3566 domain-containing protein n=1 Tax=Longimycelium tulufanense TaxID=907463 RepID=UPI0027E5A192|nr:DUF3566 domain-containing protein [Longimycelium tulufanense]
MTQPEPPEQQPVGSAGVPADDAVESAGTPPWQRVTVTSQPTEQQPMGLGQPPAGPTPGLGSPLAEPAGAAAGQAGGSTGRTTVQLGGINATLGRPSQGTGQASGSGSRRPGRGPRRASLQVKRVDPWSVLKLALVLSVALFFVWMVAVGVLYGVLNGMGVWESVNGAYGDLVQTSDGQGAEPLISAGRVFGVTAIIGAVNIVLFTALATVAAFVYNVSADLVGGVEVTLSERE